VILIIGFAGNTLLFHGYDLVALLPTSIYWSRLRE